QRADQFQAQGLSAEEAARRAQIQFGNPVVQRERTRDADIAGSVDATIRNVRQAIRALARTPGLTLTVVLTLALANCVHPAATIALSRRRPPGAAHADRRRRR